MGNGSGDILKVETTAASEETVNLPFSGYGDITMVKTTGASEETAKKNMLTYSGVRASHTMAERDAGRMEKYRSKINKEGEKYKIDPALIAAIFSRDLYSDNPEPQTWGQMQDAIFLRIGTLVNRIKDIRFKFPLWTTEQQLKGGIAAYNVGVENVIFYDRVDQLTASGDYSNDVVARAQWYKDHGF